MVYTARYMLAAGADHDLSFPVGVVVTPSLPDRWLYTRSGFQLNKRNTFIPL